ncbi:hypothetical protein RhiJN_04110 [Ceratobasidium sp. AG-Ba]|nr:hypothetical protein RhiJN_04110 [Ceratobasidium sp. AG-Ba]
MSALGIPGIALSPYPLGVQLRRPPPHVQSRPFKHTLGGILQEEHLTCFLDSEYRLRQWGNELAKLALRIAQTDEAIIPSAAKSCSKIIDRGGDINLMSYIARRNHLEKLLPRLAKVQEMIHHRSKHNYEALDNQDIATVESNNTRGGQPPPNVTSSQPLVHFDAMISPASLLKSSSNEMDDVSPCIPATQSLHPTVSDISINRDSRRRTPYPAPSSLCLHSAEHLSPTTPVREPKA